MTSEEKAQCVVNAAKDQYNLMGMEARPIAVILLKALSSVRLHRDRCPPEVMIEAYRQVRQEEADTLQGKPAVLTRELTMKERVKVLRWMKVGNNRKGMSRKDRQKILRAVSFLRDYWYQ